MKKFFGLLMAIMFLCTICGCVVGEVIETETETTTGENNSVFDPGVIFDREMALAKTYSSYGGYFEGADIVARNFIEDVYSKYGVINSFVLENPIEGLGSTTELIIKDHRVGIKNQIAAFVTETDYDYMLEIQLILVTDDTNTVYLSGVLPAEKKIERFEDLYEYMKADTRFELLPYPTAKLSEGVKEINLSKPENKAYADMLEEYYSKFSSDPPEKFHMSGDKYITERNCSLYLLDEKSGQEKLILQGNDEYGETIEAYGFIGKIDDNRFLYVIGGWEWTIALGTYDISAFEDHVFSKKAIGYQGIHDGYFYVNDGNRTLTKIGLNNGYKEETVFTGGESFFDPYGNAWQISPDYTKLARWDDHHQTNLSVYSLTTGEKLAAYEVNSPYSGSGSGIIFYSNDKIYINGSQHALWDEYIYEVTLK
ncbi:MAG: hypothetical protein FWF05_09320 [Oscillospiraceae bacterium]|nr:hypothetical protein [Oscillospiraceae bacterium]